MEVGEALVTDVGAVAVLAPMTCAGVVDVDIGAGGEACEQELVLLAVERGVTLGEDVDDSAGSQGEADAAETT